MTEKRSIGHQGLHCNFFYKYHSKRKKKVDGSFCQYRQHGKVQVLLRGLWLPAASASFSPLPSPTPLLLALFWCFPTGISYSSENNSHELYYKKMPIFSGEATLILPQFSMGSALIRKDFLHQVEGSLQSDCTFSMI